MSKEISKFTFEELSLGMSDTINCMITEEMINEFCKATGDFHPLHSSKEYAVSNGYENIIAHGQLISSLTSRLIGMKLPGEKSLITTQTFHFRKPIYPGDELEIIGEIINKDERFNTVEIKIKVKKNTKKVLVATGKYKVAIRT